MEVVKQETWERFSVSASNQTKNDLMKILEVQKMVLTRFAHNLVIFMPKVLSENCKTIGQIT